MYKNNIRTKKKKELFWIPHAKLITSFLFVATVIFLILMYINYRNRSDFSCLPFVSFPYIFSNIFNLFSYYGCFRIYVCYGRKIDYYEKAAPLWMPLLIY